MYDLGGWVRKQMMVQCGDTVIGVYNDADRMDNETYDFIALIHPIQWTIALPVGATGPA